MIPNQLNNETVTWAILVIVFLFLIIWLLPKLQLKGLQRQLSTVESIDLENKLRQTISQILGGALLLSGIYFSYRQESHLKFKQNNETLSNSLKQLSDTSSAIRTGAIYTLSKLSENSKEDKQIVTTILAAFLNDIRKENFNSHRREAQIIFDILGKEGFLDKRLTVELGYFNGLHVSGYFLSGLRFINCTFENCEMSNVDFEFTTLNGTVFFDCEMQRCKFSHTKLWHTNFTTDDLSFADFTESDLVSAKFSDCFLNSADFTKAKVGQTYALAGHYNSPNSRDSVLKFDPPTTIERCNILSAKLAFDTSKILLIGNMQK